MKGETITLLELGLFYLLVAGAAIWQLYDVSKPDKKEQTESKEQRVDS